MTYKLREYQQQASDAAERDGKLLMFSTNLDDATLVAKYGERTLDRLHAITKNNDKTIKQNSKWKQYQSTGLTCINFDKQG